MRRTHELRMLIARLDIRIELGLVRARLLARSFYACPVCDAAGCGRCDWQGGVSRARALKIFETIADLNRPEMPTEPRYLEVDSPLVCKISFTSKDPRALLMVPGKGVALADNKKDALMRTIFKLNNIKINIPFTNTLTGAELKVVRHIDEDCVLVTGPEGSFYLDGHTPCYIRGMY